jgi:putative NIF3 family GTP cyclohydrolase 1 type 2
MSTLTHLKEAVSRLTPLNLAETSWDNVGIMGEAPYPRDEKLQGHSKRKIVLCIDCSSLFFLYLLIEAHVLLSQ